MSETPQAQDAFPCAVGSEAPASIILNYDPKVRCPLCGHLAASHDANQRGTCDVCNSARRIVNALVERLKEKGLDLTVDTPPEPGPEDAPAAEGAQE